MLNDNVKQYMIEGGVKWQFTTALAPWQGKATSGTSQEIT